MTEEFKYILVVDFEATCWHGKFNSDCEIIEFPAVLYNLETYKIEGEFQQYVCPTERPKLSDYCTRLTGITQEQVDAGVLLIECMVLFNSWVKDVVEEKGLVFPKTDRKNMHGNVALMSWSNWDFKKCLKNECSRKSLKRPSYFNQWIDLRATYEDFFHYPPRSFVDALDFVGLKFEGRVHSGLHDARNIAKLAGLMHKKGFRFKITEDLLPPKNMNFPF